MMYVKESQKSVSAAATDFEAAVKAGGFGVLHIYDLQATLQSKGFELPHECRIFEVCNPAQAVAVLATDMALNMALPCRVSVYEEGGATKIGMIRPTGFLKMLSSDPALGKTAEEVEAALCGMIDAAV